MNEISKIKPEISIDNLLESKANRLSELAYANKSKKNLTESDKKEIEKAARGFESVFINMLYKQMKEAMLDKPEDNGDDLSYGDDILGEYGGMLFADQIAKTGTGIGPAEKIYENLTGGDKLQPIIIYKPEVPVSSDISSKPPGLTANPRLPIPNVQLPSGNSSSSDVSGGNFVQRVTDRLKNFDQIISEASQKFNVPENLIKAVITAESAGKPDAVSSAGAKGLMQLMDSTAKGLGVNNSYDPKENIFGGTQYLSQMLDRFGNNVELALAAYNAGPGNVEKHNGVPPFNETKGYIKRVQKFNQIFLNKDSEQ